MPQKALAAAQFLGGDGVVDGFPFHLDKERRKADRDIGKHEDGESKDGEYLAGDGSVDLVPFGDGGDETDGKEHEVHTEQRPAQREQCGQHSGPFEDAQRRQGNAVQEADRGKDDGGHDGHGHIDAAPIAAGGAAQQAGTIPAKDLQVATRPAQPLAAGLCKIGGLFIVDDGILADGDTVTGKNIVDGKFDILHQQVERPAAAFVQDLLRKEEPGAGNGAAAAKRFPRAIKETAFP